MSVWDKAGKPVGSRFPVIHSLVAGKDNSFVPFDVAVMSCFVQVSHKPIEIK
jgi:hypothetical protein